MLGSIASIMGPGQSPTEEQSQWRVRQPAGCQPTWQVAAGAHFSAALFFPFLETIHVEYGAKVCE